MEGGRDVWLFPPIADYGFLSDCEVTALIASSGNVEGMCLPRMDSPRVVGAPLDRGAGSFRLGPADVMVPASRRYLPGTMILETSWESNGGWVIVRDLRPRRARASENSPLHTFRRSPADYDATHVLLRTVRCEQEATELSVRSERTLVYPRKRARWEYTDHG